MSSALRTKRDQVDSGQAGPKSTDGAAVGLWTASSMHDLHLAWAEAVDLTTAPAKVGLSADCFGKLS